MSEELKIHIEEMSGFFNKRAKIYNEHMFETIEKFKDYYDGLSFIKDWRTAYWRRLLYEVKRIGKKLPRFYYDVISKILDGKKLLYHIDILFKLEIEIELLKYPNLLT